MNPARITDVRPLTGHWLRLWFADGAIIDVDAWPIIAEGEVFEHIRADRDVFARVEADGWTIVWPGEIDLCPDVLYGHGEPVDGTRFARRVVRPGSDIA